MTRSGSGSELSQRKRDYFFVCCFAFFAFSSFFSDAFHGLGLIHGDGFWAGANRWYAEVAQDQFFLADHPWVRYATAVSGLVFGPFYLVMVYAFVRGANWIRTPALIYVGAMVHGTVEFMWWEYSVGPPPGNFLVFWAFNAPYVIVPVLLGFRMWKQSPFGAEAATV
jgi:hypothetical protein